MMYREQSSTEGIISNTTEQLVSQPSEGGGLQDTRKENNVMEFDYNEPTMLQLSEMSSEDIYCYKSHRLSQQVLSVVT